MANGRGRFDVVFAALKYFDELGFSYGILCTITQASVNQMDEIVAFFCAHLKPKSIHLEPLLVCGRCLTTKMATPDPRIFLREYRRAEERAKECGVPLYYSGSRTDSLTSTFCGAAGHNFVVLPDGSVTSCLKVCRISDPRAGIFFYGRYDPQTRSFLFDHSRRELLANRTVQNIPYCANCFLKWHCAGDCLAKAALQNGDIFNPAGERCWLNQELAKEHLAEIALAQRGQPVRDI